MENERDIVSAVSHAAHMVQSSLQKMVGEYQAPHIIERPKFGKEGDQYYFLKGENIKEGVAGFGDTPHAAAYNFDRAWQSLKPIPTKAPS